MCPMLSLLQASSNHLKIRSVARVLAVDHVEATILGVGGLGGVQVDAKDEQNLAVSLLGEAHPQAE